MEDFGLAVSYVYIVPLFYLNCVLKGYPRRYWSLQRNGKAFQSPVEVFWIEVQTIWVPLKNWWIGPGSAVGNCPAGSSWSMKSWWLSKSISRSSLLSLDGGRGRLGPEYEPSITNQYRYRIRYRIRYGGRSKKTFFVHSILIRYRRKTVDIDYDFQNRRSLALDIGTISIVFLRFWLRYRTAISGYTDIKGKNFHVVQDIGAISGYTDIKVFPSISKIRSILGTICHTLGGRAHRPRYNPADSDGSSLLFLNPLGRSVLLRHCLDALSCWSSAAAFCCCSGQALVWTAGWSRWAVLISIYCSTSDLVMIQMMSVKSPITLSTVSCLHSASNASVFAGQGAEPAGPAATDWHCWATAAWGLQTDDLASRLHEVMLSKRQ